jgi:hypothetical protein
MAFDQNKPTANGSLVSSDVRNNFQHLKDAISKEHNWSDTDANSITHKLDVLKGKQLFTSSGTFTVPAGVTKVSISMCGGGGGGGATAHGGGCGAATVIGQHIDVIPGESITVTVGAGGAGGAPYNNGVSGGVSSFGSYFSVSGGGGGGTGIGGGTISNVSTLLGANGTNGNNGTPDYKGGAAGFNLALRGRGGDGTTGGSASAYPGSSGFVLVEW